VDWSPSEVLEAVRSSRSSIRAHWQWTYQRAELDGDQVPVVFGVDAAAWTFPREVDTGVMRPWLMVAG
jgi:hypothetical protein